MTHLKTILCAKVEVFECVVLVCGWSVCQEHVSVSQPGGALDLVEEDLALDAGHHVPGDGDFRLVAVADLEVEDRLGAGLCGVLSFLKLHWNVTDVADPIEGRHSHTVLSTRCKPKDLNPEKKTMGTSKFIVISMLL